MLFNPYNVPKTMNDQVSQKIYEKTVQFFENKGLAKIKQDDREGVWYQDFLDHVCNHQVFYKLLGLPDESNQEGRFDMWRNLKMNEVFGYYGLSYWYTWQVTILGLGPIWMSKNKKAQHKTLDLLKQGAVFAYGARS